jgi:anionic cell wall polymer biosynthesis LytR-Cps2A-Psr (LCP) family protein
MKGFITKLKRKISYSFNRRRYRHKKGRTSTKLFSFSIKRRKKKGKKIFEIKLNKLFATGVTLLAVIIFFGLIFLYLYSFLHFQPKRAYKDDKSRPVSEWRENDRLTILLVGLDRTEDEFAYIDALTVLIFDPSDQSVGIFDINVNTTVYSGEYQRNFQLKNLYNWAVLENKDSPVSLVKFHVEKLLAVKIDRYIATDKQGLIKITDNLGGISVNNPISFSDHDLQEEGRDFSLAKGIYRLNGEKFYNFLCADDDGISLKYFRQLEGVKGILKRMNSYIVFIKLPTLLKTIEENLYTDFSKQELMRLIFDIMRIKDIKTAFMGANALEKRSDETYIPNLDIIDQDLATVFSDTRVNKEQARVEIFNSTNIKGLGTLRARTLKNSGVDVIRVGDISINYNKTTIFTKDQQKYFYTINAIKKTFDEEIDVREDIPSIVYTADLVIVLGDNVVSF